MISMQLMAVAIAEILEAAAPIRRIRPSENRLPAAPILAIPFAGFVLYHGAGVAVSALMVGLTIGWILRQRLKEKRRRQAAEATAAIVGSLAENIKGGASPQQSWAHVASEPPATIPMAMRDVVTLAARRCAAGASVATVLLEAPAEFSDLRATGRLWSVAERRGIGVSTLLRHMQQRIDAAVRHERATVAALQGPRATATILALLPLAGIGMGAAMGANPVSFLTGTTTGAALLLSGTSLACTGFVWVELIVTRAAGGTR
ncbi:type II secretion system F family protein [Corynebacterium sp. H128]|uniref:type II secretion system F family protein n=1 Tax=Corynebacterium sp. H128 TaxID=3133427 RepID=UPI0030B66E8B